MQYIVGLFLTVAVNLAWGQAPKVETPLAPFADRPLAVAVDGWRDLRTFFGLSDLVQPDLSGVKVAVLDKGFAEVYPPREDGRRWLPASTEVVASYPGVNKISPLDPDDIHGTHMAHVVWAMTGYQDSGPKFRLYNASTPEYLLRATEDLIAWGADIVLFSQNWEGYGNFDGSGFVDEAVREVTDHRILWINAAGNYGGKVHNGPVRLEKVSDEHAYVKFDGNNWYLEFENRVDENPVTISLAWNSVHPGWEPRGTDKDLDLYLYAGDESGKLINRPIAKSELKQIAAGPEAEGQSLHPVERLEVVLPQGKYFLAVRAAPAMLNRFDAAKDSLRVAVVPRQQAFQDEESGKRLASVSFASANGTGEIMVPADGSGITVGDLSADSAKGPTRDGRGKPEILMERNHVRFSSKEGFYGTSYAAAYLAGIATVLKGKEPSLTAPQLLTFRKFYPTSRWEKEGWLPFAEKKHRLDPEVADWVEGHFGADHLFVRERGTGHPEVGLTKDFLSRFTLPDEVRKQPDDYHFFFQVTRTPTTKTVKDPDREEWKWVTLREGYYTWEYKTETRSRKVMTKQGRYYWDYDTQVDRLKADVVDFSGRKWGELNFGYLYTFQPKKKYDPPEYDYQSYQVRVPVKKWVPAKRDFRKVTIPGQVRQVPGPPIVKRFLTWVHKDETTTPWKKYGGSPEEFTPFVRLEAHPALGEGLVVDGSRSEPRIWRTPGEGELRAVVNR